jgi:hypothetical protein
VKVLDSPMPGGALPEGEFEVHVAHQLYHTKLAEAEERAHSYPRDVYTSLRKRSDDRHYDSVYLEYLPAFP